MALEGVVVVAARAKLACSRAPKVNARLRSRLAGDSTPLSTSGHTYRARCSVAAGVAVHSHPTVTTAAAAGTATTANLTGLRALSVHGHTREFASALVGSVVERPLVHTPAAAAIIVVRHVFICLGSRVPVLSKSPFAGGYAPCTVPTNQDEHEDRGVEVLKKKEKL